MQVFIVGTPLETAMALDPKRLRKQIIECRQILDALNGAKAWSNHPCVLQYKGYEKWLRSYKECLEECQEGKSDDSPDGGFYGMRDASRHCEVCKPPFHTQEYFEQMKRRLFEKDEEHYKQWSHLGKSLDDWYYIDGKFVKYRNGRKVEE